ncbi:hypothetical protein M3Y99_00975400 [Aphelenchoides fujianensis]|nr:hypothetical protein M3Y99_00975400 [Aphelenchoides fujianensis]
MTARSTLLKSFPVPGANNGENPAETMSGHTASPGAENGGHADGRPFPRQSRFAPAGAAPPPLAGLPPARPFFPPGGQAMEVDDRPSFFNNPHAPQAGPPRMPLMGGPPRMPPFGGPAPGFYGAPGDAAPVRSAARRNARRRQPQPMSQAEKLKKIANVPPGKELWVETKTADGKSYFYHSATRATVWERPPDAVVMEQSELQKLIDKSTKEEREARERQQYTAGYPAAPFNPNAAAYPPFTTSADKAWQEHTAPDGRKYYFNPITQENTWVKPEAMIQAEKHAGGAVPTKQNSAPTQSFAGFNNGPAEASPAAVEKPENKNRPVSSTAVPGTPWCVVWTRDEKVFFFNPSTKTSVWERPPDLYNRADVDIMVTKRPEDDSNGSSAHKRPLSAATSEAGGAIGRSNGGGDSRMDEDDENDSDGSELRNARQEEEPQGEELEEQRKEKERKAALKKQPHVEKPEDPAIRAERLAQQERAQIPLEERIQTFRTMLEEKQVSATSTWEKELSKIVFDPRYLLLSATERRAAFEAYTKERIEIERAEKKKRAKEAKEGFKALLEEAKLNGKSTFSSFSSKHGKDDRFKAVEKMRDREEMFNDYVSELYKAEKEEKKKQKEKAATSATIHKYLDSSTREQIFRDYVATLPESDDPADRVADDEPAEKEVEKTAAEKAIEDRKRQVEAEMGEHRRERDKELERHKLQEDQIREHLIIADDDRFAKLVSSSDRRNEKEFEAWAEKTQQRIYAEFEELLRETKIITHMSQKMIAENEQHLKDILAVLENDKRYLVLNDEPNQREKLLDRYLDELERQGPPKPPTTAEAERERNK